METRTIVQEVYQFDELDDAAKETARDWYRECIDSNDFDCEIDEFASICEKLGIDLNTHEVTLHGGGKRSEPNIYWSVSCCQSDYAAFEGVYDYKATAIAELRHINDDETWEPLRIARGLARVQGCNAYGLRATIRWTNYYGFSITVEDRRNEMRDDEALTAADNDITELMKDLARYLYKQLRDQSDYLYSDEHVDECICANEYEFDEDGRRA